MIGSLKKIIKDFLIVLNYYPEVAIVFVFAALLTFAIPVYLIARIYQGEHLVLETIISLMLIASYGVGIRDLINKKRSNFSIAVGIFWWISVLLLLIIVI